MNRKKLTNEEIKQLKRLASKGFSVTKLAKFFDRSEAAIEKELKKHVK